MIKILYPETMIILALSALPTAIILTCLSAVKRRNALRIVRARDSLTWYLFQSMKILSLVFLIIASGVPVYTYRAVKQADVNVEERKLQDIVTSLPVLHVVLIDESYSMSYMDVSNTSRFDLALRFVEDYLNQLQEHDQILLIGFAKEPRLVCYGNTSTCREKLGEVSPTRRYTNIAGALTYAYTYVEASQMPAIILVVTDAAFTYGGDPYEAISIVNKSGYPIVFAKVGFDNRGDRLVSNLVLSGVKVLYINKYATESIDPETFSRLMKDTVKELRGEAFVRRKYIVMNIPVEEKDISPTIVALLASLLFFLVARLEGY